jgi:DNA-binding CsgD family transcriptional regulator
MDDSALSTSDLRALRAVNDALLDPLSHDTIEEWLLAVCARFETLCHASATFAGYSLPTGEARFVSRHIPQKYLNRLSELSLLEPGSLRSNDPAVEQVMDAMRQRVSTVALSTDLIDPGGPVRLKPEEVKETPIFREVACPLGVPGSALLFHSGASGEFMIHAAFPDLEHRPFGEATRGILSVLLPGFAASIGALVRLGSARRAVGALLDALPDGAAVFDSEARKSLARNTALQSFLRQEPDAERLQRRIRLSAAAAVRSGKAENGPPAGENRQPLSGGWRSASGVSYRLRTLRLPAGCLDNGESIVVLVQRVGPQLPEPQELISRFGFTQRESEVAQRLALGRSDREIAAELNLSPHTVRHHAESVFVKAGVSSRKALLLHLGSVGPGRT